MLIGWYELGGFGKYENVVKQALSQCLCQWILAMHKLVPAVVTIAGHVQLHWRLGAANDKRFAAIAFTPSGNAYHNTFRVPISFKAKIS